MEKLLSIIIPSYNMEAFLPKCLGSLIVGDGDLLEQLDVIVVNDGSKDRTSEIAHDFASRYPRVFRVIDKPNGHYGSCINAALPVARGTFIKVLDADDWFDATVFSNYLRFMSEAKQSSRPVDLLLNDFDIVDSSGCVVKEYRLPYSGKYFSFDEVAHSDFDLIMHAVAYRTDSLRSMNYKQTEGCVYTDTEWMFLPMLSVRSCAWHSGSLYKYLVGREGQSVSPACVRKNAGVQLKILVGIFYDYLCERERVDDAHRMYLEHYVRRISRFVLVSMFREELKGDDYAVFVRTFYQIVDVIPGALDWYLGWLVVCRRMPFAQDCVRKWYEARSNAAKCYYIKLYRYYNAARKIFSFFNGEGHRVRDAK